MQNKSRIENVLIRRKACGAENAIPMSELANIIGVSARTLRQQITDERRSGVPILSHTGITHGYYLPADGDKGIEEMADYSKRQRMRGASAFKLSGAVDRTLRAARNTEQITIDE